MSQRQSTKKKKKNFFRIKIKRIVEVVNERLSNLHLGKIIRGAKERTLSSEGIVYARKVNPRESCKLHKRFHRWHSCKTLLPIPSGDSAVCMCTRARARVTTPVTTPRYSPPPSPPISDAPLHTVARALLGFCY